MEPVEKEENSTPGKGWSLAAVILLSAFVSVMASCQGGILFEETTADPHPPSIENFIFAPQSIMTGGTIRGSFTYIDPGADIELLSMRDTSGSNSADPTPVIPGVAEGEEGEGEEGAAATSVFFFPGTTGTTEWELILDTNQAGTHTIKVWLEDSKDSRSDPVFFEVFITF
jgi:hypothetical protein